MSTIPLTTKALFSKLFPPHVVAFTSDQSIDFSLKDIEVPFTEEQVEFLRSNFDVSPDDVSNIHQVHGEKIIQAHSSAQALEEADGIITNKRDHAIVIRTADCLPVFIYDPVKECVGLVHAGWRGSQKQIVIKAVEALSSEYGCSPKDLNIVFGPAIGPCHYEVSEEFEEYFPQSIIKNNAKIFMDLVHENKKQLLSAGVLSENILVDTTCTYCEPQCFSYRRDGDQAGRMLSLMMLKSKG